MNIGRFLLRLLLVPFGLCVAATVGILVVVVAEWRAFMAYLDANPDAVFGALALLLLQPWILMIFAGSALIMLSPAIIGVLISEFFAVRSWIFHVGNGIVSAWVGWQLTDNPQGGEKFFADPMVILLMGLFAGLAYWLIAGWSAGFWRPVFDRAPPPPPAPPPPTGTVVNPR